MQMLLMATEIDINELIKQVSIPFKNISDEEIKMCVDKKIFLAPHCVHIENKTSKRNGLFSVDEIVDVFTKTDYGTNIFKNEKTYDIIRIATIINDIQNNLHDYVICLWEEENDECMWDTDGLYLHHIRAFHYCKKNIMAEIWTSG